MRSRSFYLKTEVVYLPEPLISTLLLISEGSYWWNINNWCMQLAFPEPWPWWPVVDPEVDP